MSKNLLKKTEPIRSSSVPLDVNLSTLFRRFFATQRHVRQTSVQVLLDTRDRFSFISMIPGRMSSMGGYSEPKLCLPKENKSQRSTKRSHHHHHPVKALQKPPGDPVPSLLPL